MWRVCAATSRKGCALPRRLLGDALRAHSAAERHSTDATECAQRPHRLSEPVPYVTEPLERLKAHCMRQRKYQSSQQIAGRWIAQPPRLLHRRAQVVTKSDHSVHHRLSDASVMAHQQSARMRRGGSPASATHHSTSCPQHSVFSQRPWRRRLFPGTQQQRSERTSACRCTSTAVPRFIPPPQIASCVPRLPRHAASSSQPPAARPAIPQPQARRTSHGQQLRAQLPGDNLGREPRAQCGVPRRRLPTAAADQRGGDPGGA